MAQFTDASGRSWQVSINVYALKQLRDVLKLDMLQANANGEDGLQRLIQDPILLIDALYVICKTQCDLAKITDEDFGRLMAGDVLQNATAAFMDAYADFFPGARRSTIQKMVGKLREVDTLLTTNASAKIDAIDVQAMVDRVLANAQAGTPFLNARVALASTPTDGPGAN